MPELPEVETIAQSLANPSSGDLSIINRRVSGAEILWKKTLENISPRAFSQRIKGQRLEKIGRRGKYLIFTFSEDVFLIHLRMSGDLRVEAISDVNGKPVLLHKHDRLALIFENAIRLVFNNPRKFGRAWLLKDTTELFANLGPEPLSKALTPEMFHRMLTERRRQLKPLLMDQRFLAGMGNIYTDEALFRARLHPLHRSAMLTERQSAALLDAIRDALQEGIRRNGASIDWVYKGGDFQNHFNVYGRKDEPCPICGTPIERLVVGQRGTHICPTCQIE